MCNQTPISNCCGEPMPDWPDCDLCPECLEHTGIYVEEDGLLERWAKHQKKKLNNDF